MCIWDQSPVDTECPVWNYNHHYDGDGGDGDSGGGDCGDADSGDSDSGDEGGDERGGDDGDDDGDGTVDRSMTIIQYV